MTHEIAELQARIAALAARIAAFQQQLNQQRGTPPRCLAVLSV